MAWSDPISQKQKTLILKLLQYDDKGNIREKNPDTSYGDKLYEGGFIESLDRRQASDLIDELKNPGRAQHKRDIAADDFDQAQYQSQYSMPH